MVNTKRPNFLIFVTDEMQSSSIGCNGNQQIQTPNINKLAKEGVSFSRAYCNNPVCMPSRATMITGLTPRQHGCITNGCKLPERIPTITEALVKHGYRTHSVGKLHLQPFGYKIEESELLDHSWEAEEAWRDGSIKHLPEMYYGFQTTEYIGGHVSNCFGDYLNWLDENQKGMSDLYKSKNVEFNKYSKNGCWRLDIPEELHYNHWIGNKCIEFFDNQDSEQPFFLWCSFPDPHFPFAACKPYSEMYNPDEIILNPTWQNEEDYTPHLREIRKTYSKDMTEFDEKALQEIVAQTYGMITHIDNNIGRIMRALEEKGLTESTIVVFMADHGDYLGGHHLCGKHMWPYEELMKVPYIWKVPYGGITNTVNQDDVVSILDFAPTILKFAGIDHVELDFRGMRQAEQLPLPGYSLVDYLYSNKEIERDEIFIEYDEDWHKGPVFRLRTIIGKKYKLTVFPVNGGEVLIDLENDPLELNNLAALPEYAEIKAELTKKLLINLVQTDRLDTLRICGA